MIAFRRDVLKPRSERWHRRGVTIAGGTTVAGWGRRSRTDGGGLWVCEQSFLLKDVEQRRAARAMLAQCDDGALPIVLPRHSEDGPAGGWLIGINVATPAALRATTLVLDVTNSLPLVGGEVFSINHPAKGWRTYDIATATELEDGQQTINLRPPLRQAVTAEALEFQAPACLMSLVNAEECIGALDTTRVVEFNPVWVECPDAA